VSRDSRHLELRAVLGHAHELLGLTFLVQGTGRERCGEIVSLMFGSGRWAIAIAA
jgi:hypothetical protein